MSERYKIAIIGSGPGGLSAALTAAECKLSHVLLERTSHLSDTIFKYQKGKKVMAHPMRLPLLGSLPFEESIREDILENWNRRAKEEGVNVKYNAEVKKITGAKGEFTILLPNDETVIAEEIILGIGLQGNLRRLGIPGSERDWVQYQLDDPDEYNNERIVVVGAGDAGIENAMALSSNNEVSMVNTGSDFSRAKPGNAAAIERAIRLGIIKHYAESRPSRVDDDGMWLDTAQGPVLAPCDRVIARIGAIPPRKFLEECGIKFPSSNPASVPELSPTYESNVPGIYLIGALAGYTLIKQAINQGHEIIRRLAGDPIEPADESLLKARFLQALPDYSVTEVLNLIRSRVPVFSDLTMLQLREVMLESTIRKFAPRELVFKRGDYTNSIWNVAVGSVHVLLDEKNHDKFVEIGESQFFGELGLISGRRRTATIVAAKPSLLIETPRRTMRRLLSSVEEVKAQLDKVGVQRLMRTIMGQGLSDAEIQELIDASKLRQFKAGETIVAAGDKVDSVFILRWGSATVSHIHEGREEIIGYIPAGALFGERAVLGEDSQRTASVRASVACEAIEISGDVVRASIAKQPKLRTVFERTVQNQVSRSVQAAIAQAHQLKQSATIPALSAFLVKEGLGEATNAFIIDETLCVRCDNCEKACAATHDGISRVKRESTAKAVSVALPVACRHCENPHCMSDCPVDAITRATSGEVFINQSTCIGCSNCAGNCPYGVINMVDPHSGEKPKPNWFEWVLQGVGLMQPKDHVDNGHHSKKAVKCDLCINSDGGPACVAACPTGAAIRIEPEAYMSWLREGGKGA